MSFVTKAAVSELCTITGYDTLPSELMDAAADIVCADFALTVIARDGTDGSGGLFQARRFFVGVIYKGNKQRGASSCRAKKRCESMAYQ